MDEYQEMNRSTQFSQLRPCGNIKLEPCMTINMPSYRRSFRSL